MTLPDPTLPDPALPSSIELHRVRVPLVEPMRSAHGLESDRWSILVAALSDDGHVGWGECPALHAPTYTSEWHEGAWSVLSDHLVPAALAGRDGGIRGHPMASSAIEGALVDLELRRRGSTLAAVIGADRSRVQSCAVIGIAEGIDALMNAIAAKVDMGHRAVKLKIRPGWDLEVVRAVRSAWPQLSLAVDANGSYAAPADRGVLHQIDQLGLDYIEQPLAPGDLVEHACLAAELSTLVALDESVLTISDVDTALALGHLDAVNLKPARLGGVAATLAVHDRLLEHGVGMWCGGMLELGVGRASALAVAALPGCTFAADLGPSASYVAEDVTAPFELDADGTIMVPTGPGIGRSPLAGRLAAVTVERSVFGPA